MWTNPKTDWSAAYNPGPGDFNRIEGNAEYLKEQVDGLKNGSMMPKAVLLRAVPSDAVILEANTQRSAQSSEGTKLVKEFSLKYPGIYRFKCEVRKAYESSTNGIVTVSVSDGSEGRIGISTTDWASNNLEIITSLYGSVVRVYLQTPSATVYIRNVKICGTITMEEPEYAVLRN